MMKNKILIVALGITLLLVAVFRIYFIIRPGEKAIPPETNANLSKVVNVDELVRHPEDFKGSMGVNRHGNTG